MKIDHELAKHYIQLFYSEDIQMPEEAFQELIFSRENAQQAVHSAIASAFNHCFTIMQVLSREGGADALKALAIEKEQMQ